MGGGSGRVNPILDHSPFASTVYYILQTFYFIETFMSSYECIVMHFLRLENSGVADLFGGFFKV